MCLFFTQLCYYMEKGRNVCVGVGEGTQRPIHEYLKCQVWESKSVGIQNVCVGGREYPEANSGKSKVRVSATHAGMDLGYPRIVRVSSGNPGHMGQGSSLGRGQVYPKD